ncbi:MAG: preprotein translocase subunit SecY [Phycisphaerae bacterium]|nr:preprotein translocase subunit SecY [Phycisphaerae bacterium]
MIQTLLNVFRVPELRNKVLFTLGMLVVFRIGHWIPLPGIDAAQLAKIFNQAGSEGSTLGKLATFVSIFSGGSLSQSTIFGLGIMPYITAGIIFQLLATVLPQLKKLQEEGPTGRQKIMEYTRYATVVLCFVQGIGWLGFVAKQGLVYPQWVENPIWWVMASCALTAGTVFLMWLGEQIDKHGIGSGASMIIMAGILSGMPGAITSLYNNFDPADSKKIGWMGIILLVAGFTIVISGAVLMTVAQRRIPVQQAKHTRGRKVFGGQRSYLPLRINHGGVMPIIFASSLMMFPSLLFGTLSEWTRNVALAREQAAAAQGIATDGSFPWYVGLTRFFNDSFHPGEFPYIVVYIAMVYIFSYFWITVQFNPEEMSKQLKEHGSFIPGLRPGPRTAEYLETVMVRITYVGAGFLSIIAVLPAVVNKSMNIDYAVTQFLGGTGLLIVVSVTMDFLQRVEANLLMRNYAGFLGGAGGDDSGPRMRGPRG